MEGDDDRRLPGRRKQGTETEAFHALDQDAGVLGIALAAPRDAAFGPELLQSCVEGDDDMDRRGEAVLASALEAGILVVEIEHQRGGVALGLGQRALAGDDEAEAGNALDALVRGGGDGVEIDLAAVERQGAEGAHRVDQQAAAMALGQRGDRLDRIADAARRLAMDREDMGDRGVGDQHAVDLGEVRRGVLGSLVHGDGAAGDLQDTLGALAIGAVDQDQDLAVARHEGGQHRLDGEGAGALHRHGDEILAAMDDLRQLFQNRLVDADEGRVARTPVMHHRFLDGLAGGQRAGGQEKRITGFGRGRAAGLGHDGLAMCCGG